MKTSADKRVVSLGLVLSMIMASIAVLFSAVPVAGTVYQSAAMHFDGNETMQNFGRSVAMMDLNGDGISDLIVGAPYTTANGLNAAGAVTIYLSEAGMTMSKVIVVNGTEQEELFGWTVANVGDVNGDGNADLAVGAPWANPTGIMHAGSITLLYGWANFDGTPNATISGLNEGEQLGYSISAAGDANGDRYDDILAGAPFFSSATMDEVGRAYIFYGGDPPDSNPDRTYTGQVGFAHLGFSVSGGISIDANADMDMIAGAPGQGSSGAAYIVRNLGRVNPTLTVVSGMSTNENFSFSVCLIPDINGDTIGDIAVGAPTNNNGGPNAGAVYIFYGGAKFNTAVDLTYTGSSGEWFGWAVAAGDFHRDGISDLLVGAPESRLNATSVGRAYAYFGGSPPSSAPNLTLVPDANANFFGASLTVGGNATMDIAADFAVGDQLFNVPGFPNAGRVYVYAGEHIVPPAYPIVKCYVYVPGTTQGIQGFTLTLESPTFDKSNTTNAAGYCEITAVPGTFWLNASKVGYVTNSSTISLAMDDVISVKPFYPLKTPEVTGVVRDDPSSLPINRAVVALYNGTTLVDEMVTGTNGTYWFWLPDNLVPPDGGSTDMTISTWDGDHYTVTKDFSLSRDQKLWLNFTLDNFPIVIGSVRESLFLSAVRGAVVQANQGSIIVATDTTDIRGNYDLTATNATPGAKLYVNVTAAGYRKTMNSVTVEKNGTYTMNFLLQPDNTPPISQLGLLPTYTTTASVPLTATASDPNNNGISEVQLWYRMGSLGSYTMYSKDTISPYDFSFDSSATGGDGLYSFYSIAVDYASNVEAPPAGNDTWTFVDSHAPAVSITAPTAGQLVQNSYVVATWTGSDIGSGIEMFETDIDSTGWIDKGLLLEHNFTSVADGAHTISVRATDFAGLVTTSTVDIIVDTTNAASHVDALPQYTAEEEFMITATATDPNGIQEVQLWFRFNGAGSYSYLGRDTLAPYEFLFDSSDHDGDGLYEFYSLAIDGAGNNETPPASNDTYTIVDTAPPGLSITVPVELGVVGNSTVQVNWTCSDAASGIANSRVKLDGGTWVDRGLNVQYAFASVSDGSHTIYVNVTDHAGFSVMSSVNITVDTAAPVVTITSPLNGSAFSSYALTVKWTANDSGSGINTLSVSRDGINWEFVNVNVTEFTFSGASGLMEGPYELRVRAADHGGLTTIASVNTRLDRTPPVVTITAPAADEKVKSSATTVTWTMSDAGSGVAVVRISIDGGAFQSIGTDQSYDLTGLTNGQHNVTIRVSDDAGNLKDVSVSFTVSTGGVSAVMLAAIGIIIIVVVAAAILMMRKKKPVGPEPPKKEGKN